jgi:hypothetical protein
MLIAHTSGNGGSPLLSDPKQLPKSYPLALRAIHLRQRIQSLLQRQELTYGVRFDDCRGATEFTYCWQIMLAKN